MHKESKRIFNDEILQKAIKIYDLKNESIKSLGGFESFIYEGKKDNQEVIIRITHSLHRNKNEIEAEIDWVNFLHEKGLPVAQTFTSVNDNLVEKIDIEDSYFLITVTEKLKGGHLARYKIKPAAIFYKLGKILGKMHSVSKNFQFSNPKFIRRSWDEEFIELLEFLPKNQTKVKKMIDELLKELNNLPKDKDSYGLIHTDAHFGNMFVENGEINLFDFDDAAYKWFISDIAIVIFYETLNEYPNITKNEVTDLILENILKGYREENSITDFWLEKLPLFLKLREITLYLVIHRSFDVTNLTDPWCLNFMKNRKSRIANGVPYLDYDFTKYKSKE